MKTSNHRLRIGYIGVGLMGHGAAKNIVTKGYPLTVFDPYPRVNGEEWSRGNSGGMYHRFDAIIAHLSMNQTIHPGEIIGSGTAATGSGLGFKMDILHLSRAYSRH